MRHQLQCAVWHTQQLPRLAAVSQSIGASLCVCLLARCALAVDAHPSAAVHAAKAKSGSRIVHAILGGGDQLYNDNVWALAELDEWLHKPREERLSYVPDKQMCDAVERAYMESYLSHTHHHPAAEFLRCTPQVRHSAAVVCPACRALRRKEGCQGANSRSARCTHALIGKAILPLLEASQDVLSADQHVG